jgi:putative methyltransferase
VSEVRELLPNAARAVDRFKLPRYARINTAVAPAAAVEAALTAAGFTVVDCELGNSTPHALAELATQRDGRTVVRDPHLAHLLWFAHGTSLHAHELVKSGKLILQDKVSCIPAALLAPEPGSVVVDACAAPGNKTTHLVSLLGDVAAGGRVHAFEINSKRATLLRSMLHKAGVAARVTVHQRSFLDADWASEELRGCRYILVDPSCSGSGMTQRLENVAQAMEREAKEAEGEGEGEEKDGADGERIEKLAAFQLSALNHALTCPTAERVVYSTCSLHERENEVVVQQALAAHPEFELLDALPEWERRGFTRVFPGARRCLRALPEQDLTNGFFVACFARRGAAAPAASGPSHASAPSRRRRAPSPAPEPPAKTPRIAPH